MSTKTQKTLAQLYANLPDNTSGSITEERVRDIVETLRNGHGEMTITSTAATSFSDSTSYVACAGTWTLSSNAHNWSMGTNGRLQYDGPEDRVVHLACSFSMTSSNNNQTVYFRVGKNGTSISESTINRKIGTGSDVGSSALHVFFDVSNGDYLELMVRNSSWSSSETVTMEHVNFFVMDMAK